MLSAIASIAFLVLIVAFSVGAIVLNYLRHKELEEAERTAKQPDPVPAPSEAKPDQKKRRTSPLGQVA